MLQIINLHVSVEGKKILNGLNLTITPGQIHAIMGPNGTGKSTLCKVLVGDPEYEITEGDILLDQVSILDKEADLRSKLGLFSGFQHPIEIPGLSQAHFLLSAFNAHREFRGEEKMSDKEFRPLLIERAKRLGIPEEALDRDVNVNFSGGEKKRNEILQLSVLCPKIVFLDETDSGLDIDALRKMAEAIKNELPKDSSVVLITHYQRLLDYIKPDFVHIMSGGKIVKSGDSGLAMELEKHGYEKMTREGLA